MFVVCPLLIISALAVGFLTLYHWILIVIPNTTTYEQLKKSYSQSGYHRDPRDTQIAYSCLQRFSERLELKKLYVK